MAGVPFESLPAGAREEWLKEPERKPHVSMYCSDIDGATPGRKSVFRSTRQYNDPLMPTYQIPACPPEPTVSLMVLSRNSLFCCHCNHSGAGGSAPCLELGVGAPLPVPPLSWPQGRVSRRTTAPRFRSAPTPTLTRGCRPSTVQLTRADAAAVGPSPCPWHA